MSHMNNHNDIGDNIRGSDTPDSWDSDYENPNNLTSSVLMSEYRPVSRFPKMNRAKIA